MRMPRLLLITLPLLFALPTRADTLALKDGRFLDRLGIEKVEDVYVIKYDNGEVHVPAALVADFHKENEKGEYVPTTDLEKKKFEKGYVPYKGRWITLKTAERYRKKDLAARALRLEQMKQRQFWRNRAIVKTRYFEFHHTLADETFQEIQDLFEVFFDDFMKTWKIRPPSGFGRTKINVYHDAEYYYQVSGAPRGAVGYYSPVDRDMHFYFDRENRDFTIDVMLHEATHIFAHMFDKNFRFPWWISEGMAEYYGASEWDPEAKTMKVGNLQSARLAVLHSEIKDGKWLKLKDLLQASRMGAVEYAWTWSFVHFLLASPQYSKRFKRYYKGLARDSGISKVPAFLTFRTVAPKEAIPAFQRYLKVKDLDALQQEWYDYIEGPLAIEGTRGLDWASAGHMMELYDQDAKARQYFKIAIDGGSRDAFVHYGYARLKSKQRMWNIAVKYAVKAIECDPLHARARALEGYSRYNAGEIEIGIKQLELAYEMAPEDRVIWYQREVVKQEEIRRREQGG